MLYGVNWSFVSLLSGMRRNSLVQLLEDRWGHYHRDYEELTRLLKRDRRECSSLIVNESP